MSSDGLFVEEQLSHSRTTANPTCDQKAWCEYAAFLTCLVLSVMVGQHHHCLVKVLTIFDLSSVYYLQKEEIKLQI